ncbi:carbohydrate deacetylase [Vibrio ouci]|uniref:Carbohydrate deacetylase n=1 Tax=Vibrio ouci TaxID=2499078 RepID=A0A4Y8WIR1_9VIBR|nr:carbohydrate deacetylase [Vibrio ouci]TFH92536.1 carbohydrate deacetylase [Vibrio ouci]
MKLILNADDFGLTESVNNAIVDCFKAGVVKSTTIMMNQPGTEHAVGLYKQGLIPEVGLHFTVTAGRPLSKPEEVSTLVDDAGNFLSQNQLFSKHDVCPQQVAKELRAQYQAAIDVGLKINHIDSHHFAGVFSPLKVAFITVANEIGLPVRRVDNVTPGQDLLNVATPDAFDMSFFADGADEKHLKTLLSAYKEQMPSGILELMCHPADTVTAELNTLSSYCEKRVEERTILTSPALLEWMKAEGVEPVGYSYFD